VKRMRGGTQRCAFGLAVLGMLACERHVQLKFPDSSPGEEYICTVTESSVESCVPQSQVDPAKDNRAHTVFVILPRECQGHFNEITVHDSGSSKPTVNVKCAPAENVIR
jgi:hypothetical protein